jgi:hypothetical protein
MKLARIGLAVRMLVSISLTYADLITDFLVLKEYGEGGDETSKYFRISIVILAVSTFINVLIAWITSANKGVKAAIKNVTIALFQLNPLVHGLSVWRGLDQSEEDVVQPIVAFTLVRVCELLFEVLPEAVLQIFVVYRSDDISWVMACSILSSVASAAFIMSDANMMAEVRRGCWRTRACCSLPGRHDRFPLTLRTHRHANHEPPEASHEPAEARALLAPPLWVYPFSGLCFLGN